MSEVFYEGGDLEALADLPNYQTWMSDMLQPAGRVLEVGAGTGNVSRVYRSRVERLDLVEPSQLADELASTFADDPGVTVTRGTLGDALAAHPDWTGQFDGVVMVNVLEHVQDDVALLAQCRQALRPGGRLMVTVPALPWLYGSLDVLVEHHRRYTRRRLRAAAERAGFEILRLHYFDALGVVPWFVAGRILKQKAFNPAAAKLYDRTGVRATRAVERLARPPVGKNLVLVARHGQAPSSR